MKVSQIDETMQRHHEANKMFCNITLRAILKTLAPADLADYRKKAWVIRISLGRRGNQCYEFHWNQFYWHGRADNAADARFKGLIAWRDRQLTARRQARKNRALIMANMLSFLTDLNVGNFIKSRDTVSADMRNRAKVLQRQCTESVQLDTLTSARLERKGKPS